MLVHYHLYTRTRASYHYAQHRYRAPTFAPHHTLRTGYTTPAHAARRTRRRCAARACRHAPRLPPHHCALQHALPALLPRCRTAAAAAHAPRRTCALPTRAPHTARTPLPHRTHAFALHGCAARHTAPPAHTCRTCTHCLRPTATRCCRCCRPALAAATPFYTPAPCPATRHCAHLPAARACLYMLPRTRGVSAPPALPPYCLLRIAFLLLLRAFTRITTLPCGFMLRVSPAMTPRTLPAPNDNAAAPRTCRSHLLPRADARITTPDVCGSYLARLLRRSGAPLPPAAYAYLPFYTCHAFARAMPPFLCRVTRAAYYIPAYSAPLCAAYLT